MSARSTRAALATVTAALAAALTVLLAPPASAAPQSALPGATIRLAAIEYGCTIGFGGHDRTGSPIAITAGHCAPAPRRVAAYLGASSRPSGALVRWSPLDRLDYAAIRLDRDVTINTDTIAPPPKVGDIVCKTGRVSGRTCGPVTAVTSTIVAAAVRVVWGDSGGPLRDGRGRVIGITSRADVASLPRDTAAAQSAFVASMLGVTAPVPAMFVRIDAIIDDLNRTIGFGPGRTRH